MTTVADLYVLQEIDLEIQAKQIALEEVEARLGESEELDETRRLAEEQRAGLKEAQGKLRDAEWAGDELRTKVLPLTEKCVSIMSSISSRLKAISTIKARLK